MVTIELERADTPDAQMLVQELEAELAARYAPESRHGYSIEKLLALGVAFFVVRVDGVPAGCGGIQLFATEYGELKRMYVRPEFRGRGIAQQLLSRLTDHARAHGISVIRLETGIYQTAAIALYERAGFRHIPPFPPYREDPVSRCYEMRL